MDSRDLKYKKTTGLKDRLEKEERGIGGSESQVLQLKQQVGGGVVYEDEDEEMT